MKLQFSVFESKLKTFQKNIIFENFLKYLLSSLFLFFYPLLNPPNNREMGP